MEPTPPPHLRAVPGGPAAEPAAPADDFKHAFGQ
jgi:hypothetical protein